MPMMMNAYEAMEIIVLLETTYIRIDVHTAAMRRIFTDGRHWPMDEDPTFTGYSVGKWLDTDGDGRFDTLEAATRTFKGPRTGACTRIALHEDNQTLVQERVSLDESDPAAIHNAIPIIDPAPPRPQPLHPR